METQSNILFRCSRLSDLMVGSFGLTDAQKKTLEKYQERYNGIGKQLTQNQLIEYTSLIEKSKNKELSKATKDLILDTYLYNEFGYFEDVNADTLFKGKLLESEAIAILSEYENIFYKKNKERKKNEWIIGECDILSSDKITDIKISKNVKTFFEVQELNKSYYYQGIGYMWLWGKQNYSVTYILMPDTDDMIERQLSRLSYLLIGDDYDKQEKQIIHNNDIIKKMPLEMRIKRFEFNMDYNVVEELKVAILRAREYYLDKYINSFCAMTG
jgi:hypothetical protein